MDKEILYSRELIQKRVQEIAGRLSADYAGRELVVIGIL
jgi:hypoxanthine phosphoribosyltransferase